MADRGAGFESVVNSCSYSYETRARLMEDVGAVLRKVPTLGVAVVTGVSETRSWALCAVEGSVAVSYQRKTILVPLRVVVLDGYPNRAPLCTLLPSDSLSPVSTRLLDSSLRIRHPSLDNWSPGSTLSSFIPTLIQSFNKQCPVCPTPSQNLTSYGVSVGQINEKIRGKVAFLSQEVQTEIKALRLYQAVLPKRKAALEKGGERYRQNVSEITHINDDLRAAIAAMDQEIATQRRISSENNPLLPFTPPHPQHSALFSTVASIQALEDSLSLLESRFSKKPQLDTSELRLYRESAHDYFLALKRAERLSTAL